MGAAYPALVYKVDEK